MRRKRYQPVLIEKRKIPVRRTSQVCEICQAVSIYADGGPDNRLYVTRDS